MAWIADEEGPGREKKGGDKRGGGVVWAEDGWVGGGVGDGEVNPADMYRSSSKHCLKRKREEGCSPAKPMPRDRLSHSGSSTSSSTPPTQRPCVALRPKTPRLGCATSH